MIMDVDKIVNKIDKDFNDVVVARKALELLKMVDNFKDKKLKYHLYTQLQRWVEKNVSNKIQAEILAKKNRSKEISRNNI